MSAQENTIEQRLADLQAEAIALHTKQAIALGAAWEVLYRLGGTMTKAEYDERLVKLQAADNAARTARQHTDMGFALLVASVAAMPTPQTLTSH